MEKFINKIARKLYDSKRGQLEDHIVVLPSRRAGTFFKQALSELNDTPIWMPKIYSIEEWLEELSGYLIVDRMTLLFEMYDSYKSVFPKKEQDSFESFLKWAPTLLTDYNDIDAYLERPQTLFNYLHQAKKIEAWAPLDEKPSKLVKNYLRFWELMGLLFIDFKKRLKTQNIAFQGMAYRKAFNNINSWVLKNKPEKKTICYVGFNAMNPCEEGIMRFLIAEDIAEAFWDADTYYLKDEKQEAGRYLRQHKLWSEYENRDFNWLCSELKKKKEINVFGVAKGVAQAQLAGALIDQRKTQNRGLKDVALVLADENLLLPVLEFIPDCIDKLNITMGNSLRNMHLYSFFDAFFQLHINREKLNGNKAKYYYKDLFKIWQHPFFQSIENTRALEKLKHKLQKQNISFPSKESILDCCDAQIMPWVATVLNYKSSKPFSIIDDALYLIRLIKDEIISQGKKDSLDLEQLFSFSKLFNQIKNLQDKYDFIKELKTLHHLFQQSAKLEKFSFFGEPLSGLQVMGMLETRNLDFEHVILLSANEGFLPEGKSDNSFIPFDIRKEVGLPTYIDKDAVFAYHFYRLAQRCKTLTLVYNTESDAFGSGEKSRFITQLENELYLKYPKEISFNEKLFSHPHQGVGRKELSIIKDVEIQLRLKEIATGKGFSPSSLNTYKSCPVQFYYEKILKIKDPRGIEETIEANTLGTVIHRALEDFYSPYLNQLLTIADLKAIQPKVSKKLKNLFAEEFKKGVFNKGKNLLIYTVAEQFISSFIKEEIKLLSKGNEICIKGLEENLISEINVPGIDFPVNLNGNADRLDFFNGNLRIIDYKTGKVELNELQTGDMKNLIQEKKFHKGFQVFLYAYLYQKMHPEQEELAAGIISFRSLKKGFLPAGLKKEGKTSTLLNTGVLFSFEKEFKGLIKEIFDYNIPFEHRNRKEPCRFCDPEQF